MAEQCTGVVSENILLEQLNNVATVWNKDPEGMQ